METFGQSGTEGTGESFVGNLAFKHPGIRMSRNADSMYIRLPITPQRYRQLLHLVWLVIWAAGEALLGVLWVNAAHGAWPIPSRLSLFAFTAFYTAAGVYVLYRWLWYCCGREDFLVTRDRVVARRGIPGLYLSRIFERNRLTVIEGQRLMYQVIYPSWGRMFIGYGNGQVVFVEAGTSWPYARGLDLEEAWRLAELISEELRIRSMARRPAEAQSR